MGLGSALGGVATGLQGALRLSEDATKESDNTGLRTRALDQDQQKITNANKLAIQAQAIKIADASYATLSAMSDKAQANGSKPDELAQYITPAAQHIAQTLTAAGLPEAAQEYGDKINAMLTLPTASTKPTYARSGTDVNGFASFTQTNPNAKGGVGPAANAVNPEDPNFNPNSWLPQDKVNGGYLSGPPLMDYVSKFQPIDAGFVRGILSGTIEPPTDRTMAKDPRFMRLMSYAKAIEPGFDMGTFKARLAARKAADSNSLNSIGSLTQSGQTAIGHLSLAAQNALKLYDGGLGKVTNAPANFVSSYTGDEGDLTAYNTNKQVATSELTKMYKGAAGSKGEIDNEQALMDQNLSHVGQASSVETNAALALERLDATQRRWRQSQGPYAPDRNIYDATTKQNLVDLVRSVAALRNEDPTVIPDTPSGKKIAAKLIELGASPYSSDEVRSFQLERSTNSIPKSATSEPGAAPTTAPASGGSLAAPTADEMAKAQAAIQRGVPASVIQDAWSKNGIDPSALTPAKK